MSVSTSRSRPRPVDRTLADLGDVILDREARIGGQLVGQLLQRHLAGQHLLGQVPAVFGFRLLLLEAAGLVLARFLPSSGVCVTSKAAKVVSLIGTVQVILVSQRLRFSKPLTRVRTPNW